MKQLFITLSFILILCPTIAKARIAEYPVIGAQIFIEPGQTAEEIDEYFKILHDNGLEVARIRMFGAHMLHEGAVPDFTLYDEAFNAAERYGIKLFATLFPVTDELNDVGGFKFPHSKKHLDEIREYIRTIVSHFAGKPALDTWVLQNEPGTGGTSVRHTDLSDSIRSIWEAQKPATPIVRKEFLKADFSEEDFLKYYTAWYLNWIAGEVRKIDNTHNLHINPHALLHQLPEYDFRSYEQFLTSLGVSMHQSWHFGDFERRQYPLGCSIMCDITREKAGKNPFWVTELQGGNVTASGYVPFCPTDKEISQYLWTDIAAGCQGAIFWTLNARNSVMEAGEWAMLDYQGKPSDRLMAAAKVAAIVKKNKNLFSDATPVESPITILYNNESLSIQRRNSSIVKDDTNEARKSNAIIRSVITAYQAISSLGMTPSIASMDYFDWNPQQHPAIIIPNSISLPAEYVTPLINYVKNGGKVIATGLTAFYDENMRCILMKNWPLKECFGGEISEFKVTGPYFNLTIDGIDETVPAHLWRGIIHPDKAEIIGKYGEDVSATHNRYGRGEVYWIPSPINLGAYQRDYTGLALLYATLLHQEIEQEPVRFANPQEDILMRLTKMPDKLIAYIINTSGTEHQIDLIVSNKITDGKLVPVSDARLQNNTVNIPAGEVAICQWTIDKK